MKRFMIVLSAVMLILTATACASGDSKEETKLTRKQIEARNFIGDDCVTYAGLNYGYAYEESTDGKVLVDLDLGDQYGMKVFYDMNELYYYLNEEGRWCKVSGDVISDGRKGALKEYLGNVPHLARKLDDTYIQSRDLEVIDYHDGVTYVKGKADNPYYSENGERFDDWKIRYTLDGQEIIVIREEFEEFTFWNSTSLISGEYPEGFNFNNYSFDFKNNKMVYHGEFGNDIEKYRTDIPFEVLAVRTYDETKEDTLIYEYNEEGIITGFAIEDIMGEITYKFSILQDDVAFKVPENCTEGDLDTFLTAFERALYVSGLAGY